MCNTVKNFNSPKTCEEQIELWKPKAYPCRLCKNLHFPSRFYLILHAYQIYSSSNVSHALFYTFNRSKISPYYMNNHRSSQPDVLCKKRCSYKFRKIHRKTPVLESATSSKKRLWHRCFPVNFAKFHIATSCSCNHD